MATEYDKLLKEAEDWLDAQVEEEDTIVFDEYVITKTNKHYKMKRGRIYDKQRR